ncbi:MAG: acyl carrier protein [Ectothiorhodospiraceae bacterium]|nr:acyl carrier protein [Chromatiales bacterium]MCP5156038.1 acyl carrier protein [Ectothiorhodospiraceae bacterium]
MPGAIAASGRDPLQTTEDCPQPMDMTVDEEGVRQRILEVVRDVLNLEQEPDLDSELTGDLGVDSLDQLSLVMALEDEFGGSISEDEARGLRTLRDVVALVSHRLERVADTR